MSTCSQPPKYFAIKFDHAIITFGNQAIMITLLSQILQLLTTSPGNLVYHLVLAFALMAGVQAVVLQRGEDEQPVVRRYFTGFSILLIGQAILFISSALVWQRVVDPQQFLPVVDRLVTAVSFLWLAWMWAFPAPHPAVDTVNIVLNLGLVLFGGISISLWAPQMGTSSFNRSGIDLVWTVLELLILLSAIAVLLYQRKGAWSLGLGFFLVLLAGAAAHLFTGDTRQDYPAAIRLAQICVYPLLPSLARTLRARPLAAAPEGEKAGSSQEPATAPGRRRRVLDPGAVASWLQVAKSGPDQQTCPVLIQAVAHSLVADLCFLILAPDRQSAYLRFGYDLIREEPVPDSAVNQNRIPHIANALHRGRAVRIPAERKDLMQDLTALAASMGLRTTGDILAAPITLPAVTWAGIIAVSPYTRYEWTDDDQSILSMICEQAAPLLAPAFSPTEPSPAAVPSAKTRQDSASEVEELREERRLLLAEIESLRQEAQLTPPQIDLEALLAVQEESRLTIQRLEADNLELREALQSMRGDPELKRQHEHLQNELRAALEEVARLQNLLAEANMQILNLQNRMLTSGAGGSKGVEIITSIVQDIRQPVYSILGYIDLLMSEAQDRLGSEQIQYLQKIKSSSAQLKSILNEFSLSPFESSPVELAPQDVDFHRELKAVIKGLNEQLEGKNISVQLNTPSVLPHVYGDRDALHQVIFHLIQNAHAVTPPHGCIRIDLSVDDTKKDAPFLVFQVTDEGGGIAPEDLGKVFSRSSHSDQLRIPGVGDSGLGLSIAKTLVEAHGGRIWVDSQPGKTTTFSLVLPLRSIAANGSIKP